MGDLPPHAAGPEALHLTGGGGAARKTRCGGISRACPWALTLNRQENTSVEPSVGSPCTRAGRNGGEPRLRAVSQLSGEQVDLEEPLEPSRHIQGQDGKVGCTRTGQW